MASEFTRSPRLLKGALAVYSPNDSRETPRLIPFQYNPEQVRRTLATRTTPPERGNAGQAREDVFRVFGPPVETVNLSIVLSAIDQLEHPDENTAAKENGLHPVLALLELLLYPSTEQQQQQSEQARNGQAQVSASHLPLVLLVWGQNRVAPVQITTYSVTEEAFDVNLNPIQAKIEIALRVLTPIELPEANLGREAFLSYQRTKEQLAQKDQRQADDKIRGWLPQ